MTCQLYSDQYVARDLRFEFCLYRESRKNVSQKRRACRQASASEIDVVNESFVELHYTNIMPRYDRAMIRCYHYEHKRQEEFIDSQIIKVGCEWYLFVLHSTLTLCHLSWHTFMLLM